MAYGIEIAIAVVSAGVQADQQQQAISAQEEQAELASSRAASQRVRQGRKVARQARIQQAAIEQAAINTGAAESSAALGSEGAIRSSLAGRQGQLKEAAFFNNAILRQQIKQADANFKAQIAGQVRNVAVAAGGFEGFDLGTSNTDTGIPSAIDLDIEQGPPQ